jgi:hypothetical protein
VTGCNSVPRPTGQALPPNWDAELGAAPEAAAAINIILPSQSSLPDATPAATPRELPTAAAPVPAESDWISLNAWAAQNGLRALRTIPLLPQVAYAITTLNGVFAVRVGSQTAFWNQLDVRLGFAPQQIGDPIARRSRKRITLISS